jgi:hypothetical protein
MQNSIRVFYQSLTFKDKKYILTLNDWAELVLCYKDFCEFDQSCQRNQNLIKEYISQGLVLEKRILKELVKKEVFDWDTNTFREKLVEVNVGFELVLNDDTNIDQIQLDQDFQRYLEKYYTESKPILLKKIKENSKWI